MYEKELQKLRRAILKGVSASSRHLLASKVKSQQPIAVYNVDHVEIMNAKEAKKLCNLK